MLELINNVVRNATHTHTPAFLKRGAGGVGVSLGAEHTTQARIWSTSDALHWQLGLPCRTLMTTMDRTKRTNVSMTAGTKRQKTDADAELTVAELWQNMGSLVTGTRFGDGPTHSQPRHFKYWLLTTMRLALGWKVYV